MKASTQQGTKAHEARLKDRLKGIHVLPMSHRIANLYIINVDLQTFGSLLHSCNLRAAPITIHTCNCGIQYAVQRISESPALPETKTSPYQESRWAVEIGQTASSSPRYQSIALIPLGIPTIMAVRSFRSSRVSYFNTVTMNIWTSTRDPYHMFIPSHTVTITHTKKESVHYQLYRKASKLPGINW